MPTSNDTDTWPAQAGISRLEQFENSRQLTLRATQKALREIVTTYFKDKKTILEIGSGLGFMARNIPPEYQERWIQLEAQIAFLNKAKTLHPFGQYIHGSAYNLPFEDNSIDGIAAYCSFDVLSDLNKAVSETYRTLSPGNSFVHILDLGVDYGIIQKDFKQQRIPCIISGESEGLPSFLSGETNVHLYYLPAKNLDKFLNEVGMSKEQMNALPQIDGFFAFDNFQKKYNCDLEGFSDYDKLFKKYAQILDNNNYFHEKLQSALAKYFPKDKIQFKKIISTWKGKRTLKQIQQSTETYVYERNRGHVQGGCFYHIYPQYYLSKLLSTRFPKMSQILEPDCVESVTLECVIATKE